MLKSASRIGILVGLLCAHFAPAQTRAQPIDATTLDRKVLLGYQGWFDRPGESAPKNTWSHWPGTV
jgi:hypothetical protein